MGKVFVHEVKEGVCVMSSKQFKEPPEKDFASRGRIAMVIMLIVIVAAGVISFYLPLAVDMARK